jgi:hypothetical protein
MGVYEVLPFLLGAWWDRNIQVLVAYRLTTLTPQSADALAVGWIDLLALS